MSEKQELVPVNGTRYFGSRIVNRATRKEYAPVQLIRERCTSCNGKGEKYVPLDVLLEYVEQNTVVLLKAWSDAKRERIPGCAVVFCPHCRGDCREPIDEQPDVIGFFRCTQCKTKHDNEGACPVCKDLESERLIEYCAAHNQPFDVGASCGACMMVATA